MYFLMTALLEPGDEVVFPDPSFPIYESLIHFLGATAVGVPVVESRGFSFDLETLRKSLSDKTKLVILNSTASTTGGVIRAAT
jgi:aspartate/methionine/tyrosine aminotransferase